MKPFVFWQQVSEYFNLTISKITPVLLLHLTQYYLAITGFKHKNLYIKTLHKKHSIRNENYPILLKTSCL